jgi:hypothetical protein
MNRPLPVSTAPRAGLVLAAVCAAFALTSCSDDGSTDGGARRDSGTDAAVDWTGLRELAIDPAMVTLQGSPQTTTQQSFHVTAVYADGRRTDVTHAVAYSLDAAAVGSIRDGVFTTSMISGGVTRLFARAGGQSAVATVTVRWTAGQAAMGLPADVAARFASATADTGGAANAAHTVYPNDNTLFPPNISNLEVQWTPPPGAGMYYDLAFSNVITDVHLYVGCTTVGTGCGAQLPQSVWRWISETNRGGNNNVELRVRALLASGRVSESAPVRMLFAPDDIEGGIYYWTAAGNANGIYRYDFVNGDRAPQAFYTQPDTPTNSAGETHSCTGCHALSADGTRLATVLGGSHIADVLLLDVARRSVTASKIQRWAQLLSFSPDGTRLVASRDGAMRLLSGDTLDSLDDLTTGGLATHPAWSPTGSGIVFTRPQTQTNSIWVTRGEIAWLPSTGTNTFGAPQSIVAAVMGENHYYPDVTPDGRYIVYNRSVCPGGDETSGDCDAYDDPSAALWMVDAADTHHAVTLANANARGATDTSDALTNSWPRVSPFTTQIAGRRVYWLTFSSKRNYGVRLVGQSRPQLWMVAVAVPDGEVPMPLSGDPSYAAFWLPFQDISTGNHIAQWTRTVVAIGAPRPPTPPSGPASGARTRR